MQIPCPFDKTGPPHMALAQKLKRHRKIGHAESQPGLVAYVSCDLCKMNMDRAELIRWVRRQNGCDISILGPIKLPRDWWKEDWPLADSTITSHPFITGESDMNINDQFTGAYLKASDLKGQDVPVTIARVDLEEIGGDPKMVAYFQGKERGLVLNKTNANTIGEQHGPETDAWAGRGITLFPSQTDFQGKTVPCIRVRLATAPPQAPPATVNAGPSAFDDDVPF